MIFEFLICIMHDSFSFCRLCIHLCPWCAYIFAFLPFLSSQPDLRYLTIPISPGPPWCGKGPLSSLFFCNLPLHGKGISNAVHNNQRPLKFADFSACLFYFLPSPVWGSRHRHHVVYIFPPFSWDCCTCLWVGVTTISCLPPQRTGISRLIRSQGNIRGTRDLNL